MTDNQMRANKYLMQIRNASKELTELILQIEYLRYKASGMGAIRYDKDHVMTSPEDMVCEAISEAVYLEGKLTDRSKQLQDMRAHTSEIIALWNNNHGTFIDIYYLSHGSMTDVSKRIGCSDRTAYRIKNEALEEFSRYCG